MFVVEMTRYHRVAVWAAQHVSNCAHDTECHDTAHDTECHEITAKQC